LLVPSADAGVADAPCGQKDQAMGAFARDRAERREWSNDHLWLQILTIAIMCVVVGIADGMNLVTVLVGTAVFCALVWALARLMLRGERNARSRRR
jgi:Flp pilus assembly protein TadB